MPKLLPVLKVLIKLDYSGPILSLCLNAAACLRLPWGPPLGARALSQHPRECQAACWAAPNPCPHILLQGLGPGQAPEVAPPRTAPERFAPSVDRPAPTYSNMEEVD